MDNDKMEKYLGQFLDNRYELLEVIGSGGMAVVFKAMCHRLNRFVAVKIMREELASNEEFRARFRSESKSVAMLSHPNIVSVYDVSHSRSGEYIVMELVDGITLKQYLRGKSGLSWKETLHFSTQIAKALSHAHSRGLVHRDIKPQNIMVVQDGMIKVADFGIANLEKEIPASKGEAIGSVHYISPEQAKGLPVDCRSDIYSLGIVMYEMLTGKLPFDGDDDSAIAMKHLTSIPTPLREMNPDVPEELANIVMKAMNPSLDGRYQTADEMYVDLERFRKSMSTNVREDVSGNVQPIRGTLEMSKEGYARRRIRANRVSMLSGFFGVLAFILFLAIFLWNYWLNDIFSTAKRVDIPNFVGSNYDDIINSKNFNEMFNFSLTYEIDPDVEKGVIINQYPEAGKSYMLSDDGIDISLVISTGVMLTDIPDYVNYDYREAITALEKLGFVVEKIFEPSDTVTTDYIINISPSPGEKLPAGATVYVTISLGPEVETVIMPYLVGKTQWYAEEQMSSMNLTLVTVSPVYSDTMEEGMVISQNVEAGTEIPVHSKIYLQVSLGPEPTPTPSPTPVPTPEVAEG